MTNVRSILLDVEGTTTPIAFVRDVLFPFARERVSAYLEERRGDPEVRADVVRLRDERSSEPPAAGAPVWRDGPEEEERGSALDYVRWLMDRDVKSTGLKALQGKVWRAGYESGALVSPVYPDVPAALARFRHEGVDVSIFSSGSVLAQRLLFAHTDAGDLRPYLRAYFDTTTGSKRDATSYSRIAEALSRHPSEVLFVSDVALELDAARAAGMETALCLRPGTPEPQASPASGHRAVRSFDEISTDQRDERLPIIPLR